MAGPRGRTADERRELPRVVEDVHDCLTWLIPHLDKLPRNRRFTLGERIESGLLDVLELLIDATYARANADSLRRANRRLAVVRHLWRVLHDLKDIGIERYGLGAEKLVNIGRQIGGWQRASAGPVETMP
jgi:hypothetical protein